MFYPVCSTLIVDAHSAEQSNLESKGKRDTTATPQNGLHFFSLPKKKKKRGREKLALLISAIQLGEELSLLPG